MTTKTIPFTEATDVGSIAYRLHPIDVGFDLRAMAMPVSIRATDDPLRVSYANKRGARQVCEGPQLAVVRVLRACGYRVHISRD
jgi:hypothetical protein